MIAPLKLVWKFDSCLDLNTPWIWTETWFIQASSWVKTKDLVVKVWLPSWNEPNCWYFPSRNKLCIPDVYFCDFLLLPSISTSIQESSSICLIWYGSGCVQNAALRMLPSSMPFHSLSRLFLWKETSLLCSCIKQKEITQNLENTWLLCISGFKRNHANVHYFLMSRQALVLKCELLCGRKLRNILLKLLTAK